MLHFKNNFVCLLYIVTIAMEPLKQVGNAMTTTLAKGQEMLETGAQTGANAVTNVTQSSVKGATSAAKTAVDAAAKITPEVVKNKLAGNTSFWEKLMAVPGSVSRTFKNTLGFRGGNRTRRGGKFHGGKRVKRRSRNMRRKRRSTKKK